MTWIESAIWWYLMLLLLGIIFAPITKIIFGKFFDFGYPFAKIIAIVSISYTSFALGVMHLLPFGKSSLLLIVGIFALCNGLLFKKKQFTISKQSARLLIVEEGIFFVGLLFWTFVRGQEPTLHGLEKFMDFGFINSILRADYFPPRDMWLSGHSINYYYFGHLTGAVLTKLSGIPSAISYNLILATIFAQALTQIFSLCFNIILFTFKKMRLALVGALLGLFLVNFGGNLHTIYSFTQGYPNESPQAPWTFKNPRIGCFINDQSGKQKMSLFCPKTYWYPNATRFIPFTIHEFPIYSYVVADLHGHVFGIPIVILTLALLFIFLKDKMDMSPQDKKDHKKSFIQLSLLGFLTAVCYTTNAFDGPIYLLLITLMLFYIFRFSTAFFLNFLLLAITFLIFSLPFSAHFQPFVSGIGVNCSPSFLTKIQHIGPFIFENGNCQISPWWMLMILWGFFWFNGAFFTLLYYRQQKNSQNKSSRLSIYHFILILFLYGSFLILVPEFFYIKDIYPAHFRANTMFKLGYQAFIMMGIASTFTLMAFWEIAKKKYWHKLYFFICSILLILVSIYPYFAITSYYGKLTKTPQLDGTVWLSSSYSEYKAIISYLNKNITGQPVILEAQGDSYTDYNVVSSYTGLPTVAGWLVHQWLWRGKPDIVSNLSPDIQNIYETKDPKQAQILLKKHNIKYVIIGSNEKNKYKNISLDKFKIIGKEIFSTADDKGKIYAIN